MCKRVLYRVHHTIAAIILASTFSGSCVAKEAAASPASEGARGSWPDGSERYDFVMDKATLAIQAATAVGERSEGEGRARCILVVPKKAVPGNPWSWRDLYANHQPPLETELLARGFHVAFISPGPPNEREAWLAYLVENRRLSRKPVVVGISEVGELKAGTAKVSITPDDSKMPVHDKVYARSLVLDVNGERLAIVAVDLGVYTSKRLVEVCKEKFGISHLVLCSSHNHSDPGRGYGALYEARITEAVGTAIRNMFPARVFAGAEAFPNSGSTA